jgi:single-strand DNA-binding protein
MNLVILIGNLGNDPDLKYTVNGTSVCNFSIATSKNWTDKNGDKQSKTTWHRICVFGKLAENCGKYLEKGSKINITGEIDTQEYEKNGEKRFATKIIAQSVEFLGKKNTESNENNDSRPKSDPKPPPDYDDIPF